jgi:Rrf2 family protein
MKITSRFTIAVHTLLCIAYFSKTCKVTSSFLAGSVQVNPVVIRRILGQLKEAGLVKVEAGVGGASLAKPLKEITLLQVFQAVECTEDSLFHFHENPNPACPVGHVIHNVLDPELIKIQTAMENQMQSVTLDSLLQTAQKEMQANASDNPS